MITTDFFADWPNAFEIAFALGQDAAGLDVDGQIRQATVTLSDRHTDEVSTSEQADLFSDPDLT